MGCLDFCVFRNRQILVFFLFFESLGFSCLDFVVLGNRLVLDGFRCLDLCVFRNLRVLGVFIFVFVGIVGF